MENISSRVRSELRRLANGPSVGEIPGGIGNVRFVVRCLFKSNEVLSKAKAVLKAVDQATLGEWPANGRPGPSLPEWCVSTCVEEMSLNQAQQWLAWWKGVSPEEQAKVERDKD